MIYSGEYFVNDLVVLSDFESYDISKYLIFLLLIFDDKKSTLGKATVLALPISSSTYE